MMSTTQRAITWLRRTKQFDYDQDVVSGEFICVQVAKKHFKLTDDEADELGFEIQMMGLEDHTAQAVVENMPSISLVGKLLGSSCRYRQMLEEAENCDIIVEISPNKLFNTNGCRSALERLQTELSKKN